MPNLLFVFDFVLDVLVVVYASRVYLSEVKSKFTFFSLWTNYYLVIESVDAFEFFIDVFYEALGIRKGWWACLQNIYCKCSIYAFVSNPTILSAQIGGKAQRWGGGEGVQKCKDTMPINDAMMVFL